MQQSILERALQQKQPTAQDVLGIKPVAVAPARVAVKARPKATQKAKAKPKAKPDLRLREDGEAIVFTSPKTGITHRIAKDGTEDAQLNQIIKNDAQYAKQIHAKSPEGQLAKRDESLRKVRAAKAKGENVEGRVAFDTSGKGTRDAAEMLTQRVAGDIERTAPGAAINAIADATSAKPMLRSIGENVGGTVGRIAKGLGETTATGQVAGMLTDPAHLAAEIATVFDPNEKGLVRAGAGANIFARAAMSLLGIEGMPAAIGRRIPTGLRTQAVKVLEKVGIRGAEAAKVIDHIETPGAAPKFDIPDRPKTVAEAVAHLEEPGYEFRPNTGRGTLSESQRVAEPPQGYTTGDTFIEHVQATLDASKPKTIADAVAHLDEAKPDPLKVAADYNAARTQITDRYTPGLDYDQARKLSPDDPRLEPGEDAFDEKLLRAAYHQLIGEPHPPGPIEDYSTYRMVKKALNEEQERAWQSYSDSNELEDAYKQLTSAVGKASSDSGYVRAYRRNGQMNVDARRPAVMVHVSSLPVHIRRQLIEFAASKSSEEYYVLDNAYRQWKSTGEKPKFWKAEELAQLEQHLDDIGDNVGKETVLPKTIVDEFRRSLKGQIDAIRKDNAPLVEERLQAEVKAYNPDDPTPVVPEQNLTSGRQADLNTDRVSMGQKPIAPADSKPFDKLVEEADSTIANRIADTKIRQPWSDTETASVVKKLAQLKKEHKDALDVAASATGKDLEDAGIRLRSIEDEHNKLSEALVKAGTEQGRALASRKLMLDDDMSLVQTLSRAKVAKGADLTAAERAFYEQATARLEQAEKRIAEMEKRAEAQAAGQADLTFKKARAARYDKKSLDDELEALLAEGRKILTRVGSGTDKLELLPVAAKIAINYAKRGVNTLDEAVAKAIEHFPNLSRQEIIDEIAKKGEAKPRSEIVLRVAKLKAEARKMSTDAVAKREFAATKAERVALMRDSQKAIRAGQKEIQKAMAEEVKPLMKLDDIRTEIADLQNQLRTGDFKKPQAKGKKPISQELAKVRAERDALKKDSGVDQKV
jgi:hypothetical protein